MLIRAQEAGGDGKVGLQIGKPHMKVTEQQKNEKEAVGMPFMPDAEGEVHQKAYAVGKCKPEKQPGLRIEKQAGPKGQRRCL